MRILAIGDITDPESLDYVCERLWEVREEHGIDFAVANAENASFICGASAVQLDKLIMSGVDVVTGGNHTMQNRAAHAYLDDSERAIRPINYPAEVAGNGYTIVDCNGYRVMVINALGRSGIDTATDNAFLAIERALARESGRYDLSVLDFHAESTGEKGAAALHFDGKINVIFGTHTHVPTADGRVLPRGTGYITDIGMCGHGGGVLGIDAECIIERMRLGLPHSYKAADGALFANATVFELDGSFKAVSVKNIIF